MPSLAVKLLRHCPRSPRSLSDFTPTSSFGKTAFRHCGENTTQHRAFGRSCHLGEAQVGWSEFGWVLEAVLLIAACWNAKSDRLLDGAPSPLAHQLLEAPNDGLHGERGQARFVII